MDENKADLVLSNEFEKHVHTYVQEFVSGRLGDPEKVESAAGIDVFHLQAAPEADTRIL